MRAVLKDVEQSITVTVADLCRPTEYLDYQMGRTRQRNDVVAQMRALGLRPARNGDGSLVIGRDGRPVSE